MFLVQLYDLKDILKRTLTIFRKWTLLWLTAYFERLPGLSSTLTFFLAHSKLPTYTVVLEKPSPPLVSKPEVRPHPIFVLILYFWKIWQEELSFNLGNYCNIFCFKLNIYETWLESFKLSFIVLSLDLGTKTTTFRFFRSLVIFKHRGYST